jgi:lipid-binding SYLF domain-containing protein
VRILEETYTHRPAALPLVRESVGYATFSSFDAKVVFLGSGNGYGLAVDRTTGERTFMRMTKIEAGVGLGLQEANVLLVFRDPDRFAAFVAGSWQWGGGAEAGAASQEGGGAASGVRGTFVGDPVVFRLTRSGAELAAGVGGYLFTPDKALN